MTSPRLTVICEGKTDTRLVRLLMAHELRDGMKFYASQGRVSLLTLARNLIVHEGGPVLLVMDADSTNPHVKRELEAVATAAMGGAAGDGMLRAAPGLFSVFLFVPEIEVVFFEAPTALERVVQKPIGNESIKEGLTAPKSMLAKLTNDSPALAVDLLSRKIDEEGIELLRNGKQATAFRETLNNLLQQATAA